MKLGILCTHPIQYYAPLFRYLAGQPEVELKVFYCHRPTPEQQGAGFGISFSWDVDLTTGYEFQYLKNISKNPHLLTFRGCDTPAIAQIIEGEKFDAFLVTGWYTKSMWQAMISCWRSGTPLLVRGDSHLHGEMKRSKRFFKDALYPFFIRKFSACLAVGRWSEEYFARYGARRIVRSPHFVDNSWFAARADKFRPLVPQLRSQWNIPARATVFIFAGKFEEKKRPMDLLMAVKNLHDQGNGNAKFHLLMVGDGHLRASCESFVQSERLPVTFAGFLNQTEIPQAYAASDVLVLPSDGRETWGLVVNEAMASGLPAIVSDRAGCGPDLIREGKTGHISPCGDIAKLTEKMGLMIHHGLPSAMGSAAQAHIADFSVARAAKGIFEAVEKVKNDSE